MSKYNIHNDFKIYKLIKLPLYSFMMPICNTAIDIIDLVYGQTKKGVNSTKINIPGYQNGTIKLVMLEPEDIQEIAPCLIYIHGGGFALNAAPYHIRLMNEYALKTPCKVIFVDYRMAPKYRFPFAVEDCYAALQWVYKNADLFGIDKNRIAIGGDSAGGDLTAAVSLMARDRKGPEICFQMLIYPVTDERQNTKSIKDYTDTPMWNSKLNKKMWNMYLKNGVGSHKEYASPMEATSLENLPNSYIEITEFDCLRDEGLNYAEALAESGNRVELNVTKGTIHGFDIVAKNEIVEKCVQKRIEVLKEVFSCVNDKVENVFLTSYIT